MMLKGKGTVGGDQPLVIDLDRQINCFNKPSLVLSNPGGANKFSPTVCLKGRTLYKFAPTFIMKPYERDVLKWDEIKLGEHSPKYANQIVVYAELSLPMEVDYDFFCEDEDVFDLS